jgi:CRP-like cAMP-binding protein
MKVESLARALKEHALLQELAPEHIEFVSGCTKNVRFKEGEFLYREGDQADQVLLIRSGKVSLELDAAQRGVVVLETVHSGAVLGWSAVFPPHRWNMDARAARDVLVFSIDGKCLRDKLEQDHGFGYAFTRMMLRVVHRRLERLRLQQLDVYRGGDG